MRIYFIQIINYKGNLDNKNTWYQRKGKLSKSISYEETHEYSQDINHLNIILTLEVTCLRTPLHTGYNKTGEHLW